MIERIGSLEAVHTALRRAPVVSLLGPRQAGKTTLARHIVGDQPATWLDLESPLDLASLANPQTFLSPLRGLVVLDEIQQRPDLYSLLRVLVDRPDQPARFLILGSASPRIVRGVSQSLAGRVEFVELGGFTTTEVGFEAREALWLRGGFPLSYLAATEEDSLRWRESFIQTFLERDLPQLGFDLNPIAMRRLWTMLAHWHGGLLNASELGRAMGLSHRAVRHWIDLLAGAFVLRELGPWHVNVAKRQVKAPKLYLRDSGLLHALLGIEDRRGLFSHPKVGASWEGFCIEQVLDRFGSRNAWFWATHGGAELDLLLQLRGRFVGVEVKFSEQPRITRSMRIAIADLGLSHLYIIYPGSARIPLDDGITALGLNHLEAIGE